VAYAIEMFFDDVADAVVRQLWRRLADRGLPNLGAHGHGRHRPHVSLTVADQSDRILGGEVRTDLEAAIGARRSLHLSFQALGTFAGNGGVLFLAVAPISALLELHDVVGEVFRNHRIDRWPHYLPGMWVPHCTLAMGLAPPQQAAAVARLSGFEPFEAQVLDIGITDTTTGKTTTLH